MRGWTFKMLFSGCPLLTVNSLGTCFYSARCYITSILYLLAWSLTPFLNEPPGWFLKCGLRTKRFMTLILHIVMHVRCYLYLSLAAHFHSHDHLKHTDVFAPLQVGEQAHQEAPAFHGTQSRLAPQQYPAGCRQRRLQGTCLLYLRQGD